MTDYTGLGVLIMGLALVQAPGVAAAPDVASWSPANVGTLVPLIVGGCLTIIGAWKLAKIEAHVNSEKTALHEQAVARDREIELLREMLTDRKATAGLLAQAAATVPQVVQAPALVVPPTDRREADSELKAIEHNTAATVAAVKEIKQP